MTTTARWIVTTEAEPWQERPAPELAAPSAMPGVFVELDRPQQRIEGFGASFNELGWTALEQLAEGDRDAVIRELFEPSVGANLSLCRMPLGANDFSRDWYSYDEVDGDSALEHFSIENDHETLIPFIRAAKTYQPALRLWASPWSPPSWMKTNGHYALALPNPFFLHVENGLREDQQGEAGVNAIRMDDEVLATYAQYFGRFIDAYREQGIEIGMVMPQNEFNSRQMFPSCTWTPEGLAAFIRHLGPVMAERGVEIFLGTLEQPDERMVEIPLEDPVAGPFISGAGIQWHGKAAAPILHRHRPELRIYQTEQECGDGRNDWRYARFAWTLLRHFISNGATAYQYWNMALLEGGVSRWGWAQNSLVVVDPDTKAYRFTHELHLLKHVSHFVAEGAEVIPTKSYSGYDEQLAFRNPDGSIVLVLHNGQRVEQRVDILLGDRVLSPVLPADSFSTIVLPPLED